MTGRAVEITFGVDWDEEARQVLGPLAQTQARHRDTVGEPYVVVLHSAHLLLAVIRICGNAGYTSVTVPSTDGRFERDYEFRELWQDRLHLHRYRQWLSPRPRAVNTGSADVEHRFTAEISPNGKARVKIEEPAGGAFHTLHDIPEQYRTLVRPDFGDWNGYLDADLLTPDRSFILDDTPAPDLLDASAVPVACSQPLWALPKGLRAGPVEAMFTAGSRLRTRQGVAQIQEPDRAGLLHLPTGRALAADPGTVSESDQAFTVTVPPGDYPVLVARMTWEGEEWGETPAAKLVIRPDTPTTSWELGLRPGQDVRMLGDREFYGFGVDSGIGSFLDAATRDALLALDERPGSLLDFQGADHAEWRDPVTGANVIAYPSGCGDGSYPVWIGRGDDDQVTCLVADMLILHRAEPLEPPAAAAAAFRSPVLKPDPTSEAPETGPAGPIGDYLERLCETVIASARQVRTRYRRPS